MTTLLIGQTAHNGDWLSLAFVLGKFPCAFSHDMPGPRQRDALCRKPPPTGPPTGLVPKGRRSLFGVKGPGRRRARPGRLLSEQAI